MSYQRDNVYNTLKILSKQEIIEVNAPDYSRCGYLGEESQTCKPICNGTYEGSGNPCCPKNAYSALTVDGGAVIGKGLKIGYTNREICGTIRYNCDKFEGFNGSDWIAFGSSCSCISSSSDTFMPGLMTMVASDVCSGRNHVAILPDSDLGQDTSISIGPNPLGVGFLSAQKPTPGSGVGGDCRGEKAVDWQMDRTGSNAVAGAQYSVIGGGSNNMIDNQSINSNIMGGEDNLIEQSLNSTIGGGVNNQIISQVQQNSCNIAGGNHNVIGFLTTDASYSFIGGGQDNNIDSVGSIVGGGTGNRINKDSINSVIVGGKENIINGGLNNNTQYTTIGGGIGNTLGNGNGNSIFGANISGGAGNYISANNNTITNYSTIGGGSINIIGNNVGVIADYSTISGGGGNVIGNSASDICSFSTIGGGGENIIGITAQSITGASTIGGGFQNGIDASCATIGGGCGNTINLAANGATIGGGENNTANSAFDVIGGGSGNTTFANYGVIAGGNGNSTYGDYAVIGGGENNIIYDTSNDDPSYSVISGGQNNGIYSDRATISGGVNNKIGYFSNNSYINGVANIIGSTDNGLDLNLNIATNSAICSGISNKIWQSDGDNAQVSVISGGSMNIIRSQYATIGGGKLNNIDNKSNYAVISGGESNSVSSNYGVIAGGNGNSTYSNYTVIGGGLNNIISTDADYSINIGGRNNTIEQTISNLVYAYSHSILGGFKNKIIAKNGGQYTIAGGVGLELSSATGTIISPGSASRFACGQFNNENASVASDVVIGGNKDVKDRIFVIGGGSGDDSGNVITPFNLFSVDYIGNVFAYGRYYTGGADYAEYFESLSGLSLEIGTVVGLKEGKIYPIEYDNDIPIGVISANPNLVGNAYEEEWHGKYERDVYGRILYEDVEIMEEELVYVIHREEVKTLVMRDNKWYEKSEYVDKKVGVYDKVSIYNDNGEVIRMEDIQRRQLVSKKKHCQQISKEYDATKTYVPRSKRPEWNMVGLLGQVVIKKYQKTHQNWIKIRDVNDELELWLIK